MNMGYSTAAFTILVSGTCLAQPGGQPATPPPPVRAVPIVTSEPVPVITPTHSTTDEQILGILKMLTGSFKAPAAGSQPELTMHAAPIFVEGLDNALYFEVNRADTPQKSFSSGVLHLFRQAPAPGGTAELRLRVFGFERIGPTFADAMVGLWLAPDLFPKLKVSQLAPQVDVVLAGGKGGVFSGSSTPTPINRDGATLLVSAFEISADSLIISDRGVKPSGDAAFGPPPAGSQPPAVFKRYEPDVKVERLAGGLVRFDLVPGTGEPSADGDEVAVQYSGWLLADGLQFDSSRAEGRQPLLFTLPPNLIQGWNVGMPGIKPGTVRRLVIPPGMAYGESGRRQARIPGNATLVFETEVVYYKDNPPPPPPEQPKIEVETVPAGEAPKPK